MVTQIVAPVVSDLPDASELRQFRAREYSG
jgi:hypothetical protein